MRNVPEKAEQLVGSVIAEFVWLEELGFTRTQDELGRPSFRYDGRAARVGVFRDVGRTEIEVSVAPPTGDFWTTRIMLRSLLTARGRAQELPMRIPPPGDIERWEKVLTSYSNGLRLLKEAELAGDWTSADKAREITAQRRRAEFDRAISATTDQSLKSALQSMRDDPRGKPPSSG